MNQTSAPVEKDLITENVPEDWEQLEEIVTKILIECGMSAHRGITLQLPRGSVDVDVYAEETIEGIIHRTIYECKHWRTNVPKSVVHSFRTIMGETGANRGYIISTSGFQMGAIEAAVATNVELVTFEEFQRTYFAKWIGKQIWAVEEELDGFHTYYEPLGPPGYSHLSTDQERAAYDAVWDRYLFTGLMIQPFSPYLRMMGSRPYPYPTLPFDCSELDERKIPIPDDIRATRGYREFFKLIVNYGLEGRAALREVNPLTRGLPPEAIRSED